jgi:hypothetical protein
MLHPFEGQRAFSILRFTAPNNGIYKVTATFYVGDTGPVVPYIYVSGILVTLADPTLASPTTYTSLLPLAGGNTIDFIVGPGTNEYNSDTTPLDVTVTQVQQIV